jgi:thiol-disulfide isomerase/thioredoxin
VLHIHTIYNPGSWISIPKETYIQPDGGEKLFIKRTDGIPLNERYTMPASGEVNYALIFPAVPASTAFIDYGEANEGGSWFIYDIRLKPIKAAALLPKVMIGNWFDKATGDWEFGIYEKHIVYKNKIWTYAFPKAKKTQHSLLITNKNVTHELFYKINGEGSLLIGETAQSSFVARIDENGYFSMKLPFYYPHSCWVRSPIFNGSVFLEPGKELFQLIDPSKKLMLFMGETARINYDLTRIGYYRSFNYDERSEKILDMTPAQYKLFCSNFESKDMKVLDSLAKTGSLSAKAYQVAKMDLLYSYAGNKMEYNMYWDNAYRDKNKIPRTQRTLPEKPDSITADYYDFLNTDLVNNQLAVLSSGYNTFINRLKFLDILRPTDLKLSSNTQDIAVELEKSGYVLPASQKLMMNKLNELDSLRNTKEEQEFNKKYGAEIADFNAKYSDTLQIIYKKYNKISNEIIDNYFKENKIKLTSDEKKLWKILRKHDASALVQKTKEFYSLYSDSISKFHEKHSGFIADIHNNRWYSATYENLKKRLNIDKGLATDIVIAQDDCRKIVEELTPVSDKKLKTIQQQFSTPFVANYVALCNAQTIAKLEANTKMKDFVVNETPKVEGDQIFDAIMAEYKGKVVYVDFWATWCGPCRGGIEQIKPLKEELAGKDIVFVYITNPTSPQSTWANMISDIKGEHYRVGNDEWNFLAAKFNISGIPHYVLVNKKSEVVNPELGHHDNVSLKSILEKYINE